MGLRARLLLLVLLPSIPALLLALYTNLELRRFGAARVQRDSTRLVQLAAANLDGLIAATRQHLAGLSRFPQARGNDLPAFDAFFGNMPRVYTNYTDFGLVESNGNLIASSFGRTGRTNLAGRLHVQRAFKTHDLAIGNYQAAEGAAKPSLPFGYPVLDENGRVARVLYVALDLAVLNKAMANVVAPDGCVIEGFDREGRILARNLDPENWIGKSISSSPVFSTAASAGEGVTEMRGIDGVQRLYGFTTIRDALGGASLHVAVGIPAHMAYAETKHILLVNLLILGVVALIALIAARTYANKSILLPIQTLARTTRRVAAGDLSARTGIARDSGELNQLAIAFDEMAGSLQKQRSEINQLNETLERRVAERTAQLETVNKELEAFSYSVSHDLRAPLRHIGGYVEMLRDEAGGKLEGDGQRYLEVIVDAATRMGRLVDDLLAFSRMGRTALRPARINMDELVGEVLREMQRDTEGRNIQWDVEPLPQVFADRSMMRQVWANLLSNAAKYTRQRERAEIKVGCRTNDAEYEFHVRDNGAGFDMQYADKLFGVFQRLHSESEFEGTGIGLANVRRIITRHGGRAWAEGRLDGGAVFYFTLPRAQKE